MQANYLHFLVQVVDGPAGFVFDRYKWGVLDDTKKFCPKKDRVCYSNWATTFFFGKTLSQDDNRQRVESDSLHFLLQIVGGPVGVTFDLELF